MMQMRLKLNLQNYDLLWEICYEERDKSHKAVVAHVGREINVASPQQLGGFLYDELKLPRKKNRATGKDTTDEDALRELRVNHPEHRECLNAIIREKHIKKRIESYIEFQPDMDDYIGYSANPAGTETNRWSFSKSPCDFGFNVQTMPKVMRIMCDAPVGCLFFCPDLPQADARIVAWDAECERQIALFNDPTRHFHLENSIGIRGLTKETVYAPGFDETELYTVGKRRGHAANYREQAAKLALDLGCTKFEAKWLLDDYFRKAPEILRWHHTIKERISKYGGLTTPHPFNRHRVFYKAWAELLLCGKLSNESWNEACAHVGSSPVADIINVGMERLWEDLNYVRFHLHHHDSYLASVPIQHLDVACACSLKHLRVRLLIHNRPLEMVPKMDIGRNWGAMVAWIPGESLSSLQARLAAKEQKVTNREHIAKGLYGYY